MSGDLLGQGYLWAFVTVFVGGILTSLTPCVYPLIPITVSLFGARGQEVTRRRALVLASSYVFGIGVMYAGLGLFSALAGRAFGSFMSSRLVMVPLALVFAAMAASMFGAFEINLPTSLQTRLSSAGGKGLGGAFVMGLFGGIIAAPCTGPVLASVLAYVATTRSVALGASLLFTYALGIGVLFFVIAAFAISLPKSGAWMEAVKSLFGIVMLVAALYFLANVVPALHRYGSGRTIFLIGNLFLLILGAAVGAVHLSFHGSAGDKLRKAVGVLAMVIGAYGVIGWGLTPTELPWIKGETAGLARARATHTPVLIDFYADWCLPCKELDLKTFGAPEVARELERFTLVKIDATDVDDEQVTASRGRFGAATLPTVVLLESSGRVGAKFDRFIGPAELLSHLRAIH
jgi:thiol:disulfide interchange protein DsbD